MAYAERSMNVISEKFLISVNDAGKLVGIGRNEVRKMAMKDLEERGLQSFAVQVGENRILIKRIKFLMEVGGNV